ncbi:zinc finger protein RFP-like isoform X2 [Varanus komodoensis]|uniref:zinc finger protein RFP-like isoform X2 n=1 Tax=Varanus komodoensis TaxID=61221 RepID=UPI001CF7C02B|nr:zinc finger protein RFP-like isoform X2 [Varanus komodoensis]
MILLIVAAQRGNSRKGNSQSVAEIKTETKAVGETLQREAVMAASGLFSGLCAEVTCPICRDYFEDPVMTECGHNFCHTCLARCGVEPKGPVSCPQCRTQIQKRNFRSNRHLASIVELVKTLPEGEDREDGQRVCVRHQEPLKLFCKDDEALICVVCDRSMDHQGHKVLPADEASQEYKRKIKTSLVSLEKERKKLMDQKLVKELRMEERLEQLEQEKLKIRSAFEGIITFFVEKGELWLGQLDDLEEEMKKRQEESLCKLSEEISQLSQLISEMEEKCLQPASEFLQDIRNASSRCEKNVMEDAMDLSPWLEVTLRFTSLKSSALEKSVKNYQVKMLRIKKDITPLSLDNEPLKMTAKFWHNRMIEDSLPGSQEPTLEKVGVTLDADSAHPELVLSVDQKQVKWEMEPQDLPGSPRRFDTMLYALGSQRFTSGRHWWEVEVQETGPWEHLWGQPVWAVGVARSTVPRKGYVGLSPHEGIWAVGKTHSDFSAPCQLSAFTSPEPTPLTLRQKVRKIRVALDYEEDWVDFFDADSDDLIFTFHSGSFSGEEVQPFFYTAGWDGSLAC